ncbi:MFS transporter [Kibdelosporangium aridum]|uniref:MFS transporter n=1 Tax=Kibdelosporangium aridum TaxID=2030 RepID=A0A428Z0T5_KIBAR|nr:MFS transporter [Kibdelosporangium aridum]RSM78005.1 MFS transporter [Kibdelosporangium aridum]
MATDDLRRSFLRPRASGLAHNRDFRLLWIGESVSKFGTAIATLVMPLVAVGILNSSTFVVTVLSAALWMPWFVIGLPAGAWVDRLPKRPLMITCGWVSAGLLATVPIAAWLGVLTSVHLVVVAILTGTVNVLFSAAYQSYLPMVVERQHSAEANAKLQGSESVAQLAGPSVGGLLAQVVGAVLGVLADALSYVVSAVCLMRMRTVEPEIKPPAGRTSLRGEIAVGLRFVGRDPYMRALTIYGGAANLFAGAFEAIVVVYLVRDVGVSAGAVGVLIAVTGVGGIVGALITTRLARWLGSARAILVCELAGMPFALLIPLTDAGFGLTFFVVGGLIVNAAIVVSSVLGASFRQTYCPPSLLGRVTAATRVVSYGALPFGALIAGALGTWLGLTTTMWITCGALALCGLILFASPVRGAKEFPVAPAGEPDESRQETILSPRRPT